MSAAIRGEPDHVRDCACSRCRFRRAASHVVFRSKEGRDVARVPWDGIAAAVEWVPEEDGLVRHWAIVDAEGVKLDSGAVNFKVSADFRYASAIRVQQEGWPGVVTGTGARFTRPTPKHLFSGQIGVIGIDKRHIGRPKLENIPEGARVATWAEVLPGGAVIEKTQLISQFACSCGNRWRGWKDEEPSCPKCLPGGFTTFIEESLKNATRRAMRILHHYGKIPITDAALSVLHREIALDLFWRGLGTIDVLKSQTKVEWWMVDGRPVGIEVRLTRDGVYHVARTPT